MLIGGNNQADKLKGKKTNGFSTRKDGEFSLGWQVSDQLNQFQMKKQQKEQSMANKVTEQKINENCYSEITFDEKCRQLIEQNPHITTEELEQRMALWEMSNKQQIKKPAQQESSKAVPYKPQETAKNAIYGDNQATMNKTQNKVSRRNEGTLCLGDGYNYFKDENNRK